MPGIPGQLYEVRVYSVLGNVLSVGTETIHSTGKYSYEWMCHPIGDQEVTGSIPPPRSATFFHGDREIFSTVILSLPLIQDWQLSVSGERMCTILVNRLED